MLLKKFRRCQKTVDLTQSNDTPNDRCTICQKMGNLENCPLSMHHKPHTDVGHDTGISQPLTGDMKFGILHSSLLVKQKKLNLNAFFASPFDRWEFNS